MDSDRSGDGWTIQFDVTPLNRRVVESLTAVANGSFGTRGLLANPTNPAQGVTFANGVYDSGDVPALLNGPRWSAFSLGFSDDVCEVARLDMRTGFLLLETDLGDAGVVSAMMFASAVRPGIHGCQVIGPEGTVHDGYILVGPDEQAFVSTFGEDGIDSRRGLTVTSRRGTISAKAIQTDANQGTRRTITRIAAFAACGGGGNPQGDCERLLEAGESAGFEALRTEHTQAWLQRWKSATTEFPNSPDLEKAFRFAQYHLLSSSSEQVDEAAIGARGLTGRAYNGHVFWDTDVFVLPALSAMAPGLALAALRYRYHRLAVAQDRAREEGFDGARYSWESASTGREVTPKEGRDLYGNVTPIRTGDMEEHIVADVAWAATNYVLWTGDEVFRRGPGAEILMETARYWQSRAEPESDGTCHLRGVIGPDEYHEDVDDNAFTNVMASWNLRTAAELCDVLEVGNVEERRTWLRTASQLVDMYRPQLGIHEQFAGFFNLDPVMADSIGEPPLAADALLGRDRIQRVQIIKQPDVMMLHHMVPELLPQGSLVRDLEYYVPRTAHGSSLSPAITASLLARAGRLTEAQRWFDLAALFDLHDLSGTTAGGLHLATMGGLWQALTQGFFGVWPTAHGLSVDPKIPPEWELVTHRFIFKSVPVRISASSHHFLLTSKLPVDIIVSGQLRGQVARLSAVRAGAGWEIDD